MHCSCTKSLYAAEPASPFPALLRWLANDVAAIIIVILIVSLPQVWRHHVGGNADQDELVYHEKDDQMYVHLGKSRDDKILIIHVGNNLQLHQFDVCVCVFSSPSICTILYTVLLLYCLLYRLLYWLLLCLLFCTD